MSGAARWGTTSGRTVAPLGHTVAADESTHLRAVSGPISSTCGRTPGHGWCAIVCRFHRLDVPAPEKRESRSGSFWVHFSCARRRSVSRTREPESQRRTPGCDLLRAADLSPSFHRRLGLGSFVCAERVSPGPAEDQRRGRDPDTPRAVGGAPWATTSGRAVAPLGAHGSSETARAVPGGIVTHRSIGQLPVT